MEQMLSDQEFQTRLAALKGKRFPLLSHGGITLIDAMGSDRRVVDAARTTSDVAGKGDADDRNLIRYLIRHRHSTPIEFPVVCFLVECPMDLWRQWIRHRTASVNEFSSRYSEVPDVNDETPPDKWRLQSKSNRQGSAGELGGDWPAGYQMLPINVEGDVLLPEVVDADHRHWLVVRLTESDKEVDADPTGMAAFHDITRDQITPGMYLTQQELAGQSFIRNIYAERLDFGVAKEQARKELCLSTYTRAWWQCNLHNTLHFLGLRMDKHAQWEIRQFANIMGEIFEQLYPVMYQAFLDYRLNAMTLTALDQFVIQNMGSVTDRNVLPYSRDVFMAAQHPDWAAMKNCRERDECLAKLQQLGLVSA